MIQLSIEWERLEPACSNHLAEHYPFETDFESVILHVLEWQNQLKSGGDQDGC